MPAISFGGGRDLVGGREAGEAKSKAYTADKYHQPADEFSIGLGLRPSPTGPLCSSWAKLANSAATWPEWKAGAEFKAGNEGQDGGVAEVGATRPPSVRRVEGVEGLAEAVGPALRRDPHVVDARYIHSSSASP